MKTKLFLSVVAFIFCSISLQAQSAVVYGGIAKLTNQNKLFTPDGAGHPGILIGLDGMLTRTGLNIMAGFQYHKFHFIANDKSSYFSFDENISYAKLRFGMHSGTRINELMLFRVYALGSAGLLTNLPTTDLDIPQKSLNDAYLAAVGGVSFAFGPGVLSLEYEKGLTDVAKNTSGTKNNSLALTLGLIF